MITELKEALTELVDIVENVSEQRRCPDLIDSFTTQPARKILTSLEAQEARLREWEVKEHAGFDFIVRPATFSDVMDWMNYYFSVEGMAMPLPDGRELRRKKIK